MHGSTANHGGLRVCKVHTLAAGAETGGDRALHVSAAAPASPDGKDHPRLHKHAHAGHSPGAPPPACVGREEGLRGAPLKVVPALSLEAAVQHQPAANYDQRQGSMPERADEWGAMGGRRLYQVTAGDAQPRQLPHFMRL